MESKRPGCVPVVHLIRSPLFRESSIHLIPTNLQAVQVQPMWCHRCHRHKRPVDAIHKHCSHHPKTRSMVELGRMSSSTLWPPEKDSTCRYPKLWETNDSPLSLISVGNYEM